MDRCWMQGALGDALHALSCAAGYNIRWLLRAIVRLAAKRPFLALSDLVLYARIGASWSANALRATLGTMLGALGRHAGLTGMPPRPTFQLNRAAK
jgi:IS5 family transposase